MPFGVIFPFARQMAGGSRFLVGRGSATRLVAALAVAVALAWMASGSRHGNAQTTETPEVTSHDSQPTFHMHVQHNEVVVRVVVRDAHGQVVKGLQKDDFRVFDNRKPQLITHFAIETSGSAEAAKAAPVSAGGAGEATSAPPAGAASIILPRRFMALYFDDVHLQFGDLARTRDAADHYLDSNLQSGDRAGLFTSSGQGQVDFTDDRDKLHDGLYKLHQRPIYSADSDACPPISPYQSYQIIHERDLIATQTAQADAFVCHCEDTGRATDATCAQEALRLVDPEAIRAETRTEAETHYALQGLERVCQRMAATPGQRSIVVVSPGFLTLQQTYDVSQVVDQALRQGIVISSVDARGLYAVTPFGDASERPIVVASRPDLEANKTLNRSESLEREADVLADLPYETGGVYFHNSNDLNDGFRRAGAFPEAYYVLAFAPPYLKPDGHLHTLKVTLANNTSRYSVQARRGYFAPQKNEDAATVAKEELEQMIFSQEEPQNIPLQVHTQFFKGEAGPAKLSVLAHLDISGLRFRKAEGRNLENLTVVTALFDQAGNYVTGEQKEITFRLLDSTLERLSHTGLSMKASLPVKSGAYLVREIVQESEGGELSALSSQVEIP